MKKQDFISGVYKNGIFNAYGLIGDYRVKKFETGSNEEAQALANAQREVHGTYKDGVFRPANLRRELGFADHVDLDGQRYRLDHSGQLYTIQGRAVGKLTRDGKPLFYQTREERNVERAEVSQGNEGDFQEILDQLYNTNQILAQVGKSQPIRADKLRIKSTEFHQYRRTPENVALFSANLANTEAEDNYEMSVDRRLDYAERVAAVAHELGHITGQHTTSDRKAHLAALSHIKWLRDYYDTFKKKGISLPERQVLDDALAYLAKSAPYFDVNRQDLEGLGFVFNQGNNQRGNLEQRLHLFIPLTGIIIGLFLLSPNFTGNAIANISVSNSNLLGIIVLFLSIIGGLLFAMKKK
jgi:hypothetical protein